MKLFYVLGILLAFQDYNLIAADVNDSDDELYVETIKKNGKKFSSCKYCCKKFNREYNLQRRLKIHNDVRPHRCIFCSVGFREKHHLTSHQKSPICRKNIISAVKREEQVIKPIEQPFTQDQVMDLNDIATTMLSWHYKFIQQQAQFSEQEENSLE